MEIEKLKATVIREVDTHRSQLSELSRKIHANPELGFHEVQAADWLTRFLEQNGFAIKRGICDLPTAFRASYGKGEPRIALLAEYDALPDIGHGCGHNLICTIAVGAGIAAKPVVDQCGGTVLVIGTPAEELYGGKAIMAEKGAFADLDAAMMVHGESHDVATTHALACQNLYVEFEGKAAHAAARPEAGVNALDAMLLSYAGINALRQHIKPSARIHGIITDGGQAANVVPAHSAATFIVRAEEDSYLDELKQKVLNCFTAGATATGAQLKYKWDDVRYAPMRNNMVLAQLYMRNIESLGREITLADSGGFGSTDMGNVSQLVPGIHAFVAVAERGTLIHSTKFAQAAASETGIKGMLDAAKALAMTVADLLSNPETLTSVQEEFRQGE